MKYRIVYATLWLLTVIAYSVPLVSIDGKTYIVWDFTAPFSITYLIGILIGLVVLITGFKPVTVTLSQGLHDFRIGRDILRVCTSRNS